MRFLLGVSITGIVSGFIAFVHSFRFRFGDFAGGAAGEELAQGGERQPAGGLHSVGRRVWGVASVEESADQSGGGLGPHPGEDSVVGRGGHQSMPPRLRIAWTASNATWNGVGGSSQVATPRSMVPVGERERIETWIRPSLVAVGVRTA